MEPYDARQIEDTVNATLPASAKLRDSGNYTGDKAIVALWDRKHQSRELDRSIINKVELGDILADGSQGEGTDGGW